MVFSNEFGFQINLYRKPRRCLKNWWSAKWLKFWKHCMGQKRFSIFFHFGDRKFCLDVRIPNLVSKLKSDSIWPPFWPQNCQNLANLAVLPVINHSQKFFGQKGVKCCPISLRLDVGSPHPGETFWPQNERKLKTLFFAPNSTYFQNFNHFALHQFLWHHLGFSVWLYLKPKGLGKHNGIGNLKTFLNRSTAQAALSHTYLGNFVDLAVCRNRKHCKHFEAWLMIFMFLLAWTERQPTSKSTVIIYLK